MPNIWNLFKAVKISWLKRIINSSGKWVSILQEMVEPLSIEEFTECRLHDKVIQEMYIPFYQQLYYVWNENRGKPETVSQIKNEFIWCNKDVLTHTLTKKKTYIKEPLWWPHWHRAGINKINQLFDNNGRFLDQEIIKKETNISINFLEYNKLRKAIPIEWHTRLGEEPNKPVLQAGKYYMFKEDQAFNILDLSTNNLYWLLQELKLEKPSALAKWCEEIDIDEEDWENIYKMPYLCNRETKLQSLQYKIINRFYPCNKWLFQLKVIETPNCRYCENVIDSISHHFVSCPKVDGFWSSLKLWWNNVMKYDIPLSKRYILFGYYHDSKNFKKKYITCSKRFHPKEKMAKSEHLLLQLFNRIKI